MTQEKIIKLLAGATMALKNTSQIINDKGANYVEENILKGNYVTRSEFDQLKNLVTKIDKLLSEKIK